MLKENEDKDYFVGQLTEPQAMKKVNNQCI